MKRDFALAGEIIHDHKFSFFAITLDLNMMIFCTENHNSGSLWFTGLKDAPWYTTLSLIRHRCIIQLLLVYLLGLGTAYRNRTAVNRGTLLRTAVRTTVYRNSIKLTVIVNLSAAMGIHSIDMATSHGV